MHKKRNIIGNKYGNLTVIADLGHYKENDRHYYSLVKCDCGNEFPVLDSSLINGKCTKYYRIKHGISDEDAVKEIVRE